jgi:hypothetical protein
MEFVVNNRLWFWAGRKSACAVARRRHLIWDDISCRQIRKKIRVEHLYNAYGFGALTLPECCATLPGPSAVSTGFAALMLREGC